MSAQKNQTICALLSVLLCLSCVSGFGSARRTNGEEFEFAWKFLDIFFLFRERLPDTPYIFNSPAQLYSSVDEPFTVYYPHEEASRMIDILTTSSAGLGVRLDSVQSGFVILEVFPNSPAEQAGLRENDTIIAVDGISVQNIALEQFASLIRGDIGDTRTLSVLRNASQLDFSVTLDRFLAPSVFSDSLDENIAYIFITSFFSQTAVPGGTADEFIDALTETQWAQTTIIDLRNNPGGEVDQTIPVISQFLPANTPIVNTTERRPLYGTDQAQTVESTWVAIETELLALNREFIILINQSTASAAEIMVSALRENRPEIPTIGTTTFGKARGQAMTITPDSGLAVVTFALLEPVDGASYDMRGIDPQIVVTEPDDPLDEALNIARTNLGKVSLICTNTALRRAKIAHYTMRVRDRIPLSVIMR